MKNLKTFILALAVLIQVPLSAQINANLENELQTLLDNAAKSGNDGLSAAVIFPSGCVWTGVSGLAGPGDSVDLDRKWHFASNTKPMTATILLQLHEEGSLNIYDSIGSYINSADFPYLDGSQTIIQFMRHTTDVTNSYTQNPRSKLWDSLWSTRPQVWNPEDALKAPFAVPATPNPDREHRYNGFNNFVYLGLVIESVTGNSLEEEFQTEFLTL